MGRGSGEECGNISVFPAICESSKGSILTSPFLDNVCHYVQGVDPLYLRLGDCGNNRLTRSSMFFRSAVAPYLIPNT